VKAAALCALLVAGCAGIRPRPLGIVFEDSSAPLDYRADEGGGQKEVTGQACRNAIGLPLFFYGGTDLAGWGEAGYREAVAQAQAQAPGAALSDVRADMRFLNILIFRRECLMVTAAAR
jgi:hypothetical protein